MDFSLKRFNFWIPAGLLLIGLVLLSFLMEELIDASPPNYGGGTSLLLPVVGLVSFLYIRKTCKETSAAIWILQALNWVFMLFPVAVILLFMLAFI